MSLECLNDIITNNLAVHIDLTSLRSWDLNTGFTSVSLTKWNNAVSGDLNLVDFGLTGFDNGRTNTMLTGLTLNANDNRFKFYRVGENLSGSTVYDNYQILPFTGTSVGNYIYLNGGYLQGFFKLYDYNYEILPPRYNKGITIETIIEILPTSSGIFYMMGTRAEDKYNPYYSGETTITGQTNVVDGNRETFYQYGFSGYTTSEGNYLEAYNKFDIIKGGFSLPEDNTVGVDETVDQIDNVKNNIISFELTSDKRLRYKYVNSDGLIVENSSPNIISRNGWTIIDIVFTPDYEISNYVNSMYLCYPRRTGTLMFYVNGRKFWKVNGFEEWYCKPIINDKEKQIGVPFNISWGGGSFGLQNSWHFQDSNLVDLVQDNRKSGLTIEKYFNNSYIGNIQKLRIYDIPFTSEMVLHNAVTEARYNTNYNVNVNKGGRLINSILSTVNITQQTSGSDIRKTIKYRNADNSYRNLFDMVDIMVVVKSKSNPSTEIVKFKKVADVDWVGLIYMDNYTYDFIVPDEITALYPNQVLFAEIKFQWVDPYDIDNLLEKIFIVNITTSALLDNTVKNY